MANSKTPPFNDRRGFCFALWGKHLHLLAYTEITSPNMAGFLANTEIKLANIAAMLGNITAILGNIAVPIRNIAAMFRIIVV